MNGWRKRGRERVKVMRTVRKVMAWEHARPRPYHLVSFTTRKRIKNDATREKIPTEIKFDLWGCAAAHDCAGAGLTGDWCLHDRIGAGPSSFTPPPSTITRPERVDDNWLALNNLNCYVLIFEVILNLFVYFLNRLDISLSNSLTHAYI